MTPNTEFKNSLLKALGAYILNRLHLANCTQCDSGIVA
jgi:hypothetical protein